jgi:antitoxin component of MazEF toxin-antitoxin module
MDISIEIKEDDETKELYIEIPEEIINKLQWSEGTVLNWEVSEDDAITISAANSRKQSGEVNISQGTQEDWEKFWYEETFATNFWKD